MRIAGPECVFQKMNEPAIRADLVAFAEFNPVRCRPIGAGVSDFPSDFPAPRAIRVGRQREFGVWFAAERVISCICRRGVPGQRIENSFCDDRNRRERRTDRHQERWQSGRLCSTGNAVSGQPDRGFESPSLRFHADSRRHLMTVFFLAHLLRYRIQDSSGTARKAPNPLTWECIR